MPYRIDFTQRSLKHFRDLSANQRALMNDAIEEQLRHQPTTETRNRKPMRENPLAHWELRVGELRVFYSVRQAEEPVVIIQAVGIKVGNRVHFGGGEGTFP